MIAHVCRGEAGCRISPSGRPTKRQAPVTLRRCYSVIARVAAGLSLPSSGQWAVISTPPVAAEKSGERR